MNYINVWRYSSDMCILRTTAIDATDLFTKTAT